MSQTSLGCDADRIAHETSWMPRDAPNQMITIDKLQCYLIKITYMHKMVRLSILVYRTFLILGFGLCGSLNGFAQDWQTLLAQRPPDPEPTFAEILEESPAARVIRLQNWENARQAWLEQIAELRGIPLEILRPQTVEPTEDPETQPLGSQSLKLVDIDPNGNPVYSGSDNVNAAISTHARHINRLPRPNVPVLDGTTETVAIWDVGAVRQTHQEFSKVEGSSRVSVMDSAALNDHATHVAGTIGAAGVNEDARGMAPAVTILSYDNIQDMSEMAASAPGANAGADTYYVSNHSYGLAPGWNWLAISGNAQAESAWHWDGQLQDDLHYNFGRYGFLSRGLDAHVFKYPDHLAVFSAGNERNDNPAINDTIYFRDANGTWQSKLYVPVTDPGGDGNYKNGYDTIRGLALAKNCLTVGACTDALEFGTRNPSVTGPIGFTSYGPADDGRIKPDVVANGVSLFSALSSSNTEYGSKSGTSMAAPNATGTATLLQQYRQTFTPYRRFSAAELKGLLIHTADDVEATGPDYRSGWGLINALSAYTVMTKALSQTPGFALVNDTMPKDLDAGAELSYTFELTDKTPVDFKATLVWTDPPGKIVTTADSTTPNLVHDLDLRIVGPDKTIYLPFILNPASPEKSATRGDNVLDNVEQVLIPNAAAGTYTVSVRLKGSLQTAEQDFSIWMSPRQDPLAVADPIIEVPTLGGTMEQHLYAEGNWIVNAPQWIQMETTSGTGSTLLKLSIPPNLDTNPREDYVAISSGPKQGEILFLVHQRGFTGNTNIDLADALDQPRWTFNVSGDAGWIGQDVITGDGEDAAMSDQLGDGQQSTLTTLIEGPGSITFDYLVSTEKDHDTFSFKWQGSTFLTTSGLQPDWKTYSLGLEEGSNRLEWIFEKDASISYGSDRVWVDNLRFDRLELNTKAFNLPYTGTINSIELKRIIETDRDPSWQIGQTPPWVDVSISRGSNNTDAIIEVIVAGNLSDTQRSGSFTIGNLAEGLGEHTVTIVQADAREAYIQPEDVSDLPAINEWEVTGDGTLWQAIRGIGPNLSNGWVAADLELNGETQLTLTVPGPGILAFRTGGELNSGSSQTDLFRYFVNGELSDATLARTDPDALNSYDIQHVIYLPEAENTVLWQYRKQGVEGYRDYVVIYGIQFVQVELSPSSFEFIDRSGWVGTLAMNFPDAKTPWTLQGSGIWVYDQSGIGNFEAVIEVLPKVDTLQNYRDLSLSVGDLPPLTWKIQQEAHNPVNPDQALDHPGLQISSLLFGGGSDSYSRDGIDALYLRPGFGSNDWSLLEVEIPAAATVSFDVRLLAHPDYPATLQFKVDGVEQMRWESHMSDWQQYSLTLENSTTLSWELNDFSAMAFLDRLRIETPLVAVKDEVRSIDGSGGTIILPMVNAPVNEPNSNSPWLIPSVSGNQISATVEALPKGTQARAGIIEVDGETITVLQIRPEAIETEYIQAVGASQVDEVLNQKAFHPLGDHDGDKQLNIMEWMFNTLHTPGAAQWDVFGSQGTLKVGFNHRTSSWATATLQVSDDLTNWRTVTSQNGLWSAPGVSIIPHSATLQPDGSHTYQLQIQLPESTRPSVFLRGQIDFP